MPGLEWLTRQPVAHRGLHDADAGIIENTLPAVEAAIAGGFAIEVDLQAAKGDIPVVFHDDTLDRLTKESGPVKTLTPEELAAIPFKDTDARIPSLDELLEAVGGKVPLVLEIKTDWTSAGALEKAIAERLATYQGPVAVMSFDPRSVIAFREIAPGLPRGIVSERYSDPGHWPELTASQRRTLGWMTHLFQSRPHFVAYGINDLPAFMPLMLRLVFGMPLLTWTVRTPEHRARARRWANQMIFEGFTP